MIAFAWLGNLSDHFILSSESNMPDFYAYMNWFYEGLITNTVTSITTDHAKLRMDIFHHYDHLQIQRLQENILMPQAGGLF